MRKLNDMLNLKAKNVWECFAKPAEWGIKDTTDGSITAKAPRFIFSPPPNVTLIGGAAAY